METKDLITLIGIISAVILGIVNLVYIIKNRRNSIREHLYKEQIANTYKIFEKFARLNQEIDDVINNPNKRHDNYVENLQNETSALIYSLEFILSNDFLAVSKDTLKEITSFYLEYLSMNDDRVSNAYKKYYDKYYDLVRFSREQFGIEALTKENETLHKLPSNNKRLIKDISDEMLKSVIGNMITKF
ncbi:MAG: hypothetical protein V4561_05325 [Bacteroidota bacterium]